mmetsp:Transcript_38822/g.62565  ORF Transcript_38822/g.62565 Transcript_38822/m.62565 type:complete len:200 (-) Transcript_38822:400-999(-)
MLLATVWSCCRAWFAILCVFFLVSSCAACKASIVRCRWFISACDNMSTNKEQPPTYEDSLLSASCQLLAARHASVRSAAFTERIFFFRRSLSKHESGTSSFGTTFEKRSLYVSSSASLAFSRELRSANLSLGAGSAVSCIGLSFSFSFSFSLSLSFLSGFSLVGVGFNWCGRPTLTFTMLPVCIAGTSCPTLITPIVSK